MRKAQIQVGSVYTAKITNRVVQVRIDAENPHGGWDGTNLATNRKVRIVSAAKLRAEGTAPAQKATSAATTPPDAKSGRKAIGKATKAKAATRAKDAKMGVLDAACVILAKSREPMSTKSIVERALADGLWSSKGKTPHATLHAAMIREIAAKGKDARFVKISRGRFAATGKGA